MANSYTAADIKALRERTGAGMMDVKKALDEAVGDVEKAMEIIRIKGLKGATKREGRSTAEGLVVAKVVDGVGFLVEINCETDFVAKSAPFIEFSQQVIDIAVAANTNDLDSLLKFETSGTKLADTTIEVGALLGEKIVVRRLAKVTGKHVAAYLHKTSKDLPAQVGVLFAVDNATAQEAAHDVAVHIAALSPTFLTRQDVPAEKVANERHIASETALAEGKPEAALNKIIEGRLLGFFKDTVLLDQVFAKNSKKNVGQVLEEAGTVATAFARFRVGA